MSLQSDIEQYVKKHKVSAADMARDFQRAHDLVMLAESHVGDSKKAAFLAKMINAGQSVYHASEHIKNQPSYADPIEGYLKGTHTRAKLPADIRYLTPVLDAIKRDTSKRGVVFAGTSAGQGRHERLFAHFTSSFNLHKKAGRLKKADKGHFLIGALHGARQPQEGAAKTTTQRLIASGFDVGVIRLMVYNPKSAQAQSKSTDEGMFFDITAFPEYSKVVPVAGGAVFDLEPILRKIGGGGNFGVDLQRKGNPFWKLKPADITPLHAYPKYFDKLIHLA